MSSHDADAGYATGVALAMCLSIALVASAVTGASVMTLKQARAALDRSRSEYALNAAQIEAAITVAMDAGAGRLRWSVATDAGQVEILAEPEAPKASYAAATTLGAADLQALGVRDPGALADRLRILAAGGEGDIASLDIAPLWRACARSLFSPLGAGEELVLQKASTPQRSTTSRLGEVWRIRAQSPGGWGEERLVRFTGNPRTPAAIIERRLQRGGEVGETCDRFIDEPARP